MHTHDSVVHLPAIPALTYALGGLNSAVLRSLFAVARFEVAEALHSRVVALLVVVYGGGSFVASNIFLRILQAAEADARAALSDKLGAGADALPSDLARDVAMPWLVQWVDDASVRETLLKMDPLSIFMGFAMLQVVPFMMLLAAASSIASDVASGAVRFVLFRCERWVWVAGKALGQAWLLWLGLAFAALVAAVVGTWLGGGFEADHLLWLLRSAFRAWVYGLAFLGIFTGVSMTLRAPARARALAALLWLVLGVAHSVATADWAKAELPGVQHLAWLFPYHYQVGLWSADWGQYVVSVAGLSAIGAAGMVLGYRIFRRRDA